MYKYHHYIIPELFHHPRKHAHTYYKLVLVPPATLLWEGWGMGVCRDWFLILFDTMARLGQSGNWVLEAWRGHWFTGHSVGISRTGEGPDVGPGRSQCHSHKWSKQWSTHRVEQRDRVLKGWEDSKPRGGMKPKQGFVLVGMGMLSCCNEGLTKYIGIINKQCRFFSFQIWKSKLLGIWEVGGR